MTQYRLPSMAILAGGLATRLGSLTIETPKSLVSINNTPFIEHQCLLLKSKGFHHIVFCVGHLASPICHFIMSKNKFGMEIDFSHDGQTPAGTGGAIKKALPLLSENFFVLYGDSYLDIDYQNVYDLFLKSYKKSLMTIYKHKSENSNILFLNNEIVLYDKTIKKHDMNYIDYGLSIFNRNIFMSFPHEEPFDLSLIFQKQIHEKDIQPFEIKTPFHEIGSRKGIRDLEYYLKKDATK